MMLWMIEQWSKFLTWLLGGFKGVADLKDAWFVGSPTFYSGIIIWFGALAVSGKGWALYGVIFAYCALLFVLLANGHLSRLAYVILALSGIFVFFRLATAKTLWTTAEKVKELRGWGR
jgi:Ca2+/Na+ antiporter